LLFDRFEKFWIRFSPFGWVDFSRLYFLDFIFDLPAEDEACMELTLKVISGKYAGQLIKVPHQRFMIGRSEECHLRPHSELISRQHCVIITENDEISVEDLGSRNGTYVNGEKISARRSVDPGDKVKVGQLEFELYVPRSKDSAAMAIVAPAGPAAKPAPVAPSEAMNQTVANKSSAHETSSLKTPTSNPAKAPSIPGVPSGAKLPNGNLAPSLGGPRLPKIQSVEDVAKRVSSKKDMDDGDITDWLMDDDLENLNETRTIQITPAQQAELLASAEAEEAADEAAEKEAKASDSKASNKKVYGKLPPVPKQVNAAKDSREAAADVLRKMLKNR
jgi:hypothetical protein